MQQMVTLPRMPVPGAHQIQRPVRPPPTRMRSSATPFKALSDGRVKDAFGAWSTCMKVSSGRSVTGRSVIVSAAPLARMWSVLNERRWGGAQALAACAGFIFVAALSLIR
ncbi:hypothetical protein ACFY13_51690 [Streptomyces mirabilis]|uniref:hypothetical protein n=1 Tax=Streptomyces mirabilis TaxID=68239 RepID=UPI0036699381